MTLCLEQLKASKTAVELECMQANAKAAEAGFSAAPDAIQEGLREADIAAANQSAFERSPIAARMQRSYGFFYCMSGPNSASAAAAYARTRQRKVDANDLVMIHANTCGDGYWTDITRTWTAGKPTEKHVLGHGVGFAAANAKGRPRIHPASPDVLEAGMTFNVEPAIYFDGYGGMRHCDVVAVTATGVQVLTKF
jgi:Xaa-Pro aminopeptidase